MAIYASSSTITTQTTPLIQVDLDTVQDDYVLQWDATLGVFVSGPLELGADAPATGVQTFGDGETVFRNKDGNSLNLKSVKGDGNIIVSSNQDELIIGLAAEGGLLNQGGILDPLTSNIYKNTEGGTLYFRGIKPHQNAKHLQITQTDTNVEIRTLAEINEATNDGTDGVGVGVFHRKDGELLRFRKIAGQDQIQVTQASDQSIQIRQNFPGLGQEDNGKIMAYDANNNRLKVLSTAPAGYVLTSTGPGSTGDDVEWRVPGIITRTFRITFETTGDIEDVFEVPSDITVTRIGNKLTVVHPFNTIPKLITYLGKDNALNKYRYRQPTGQYQVLLNGDLDERYNTFEITVIASVAGADPNTEAFVNLIF